MKKSFNCLMIFLLLGLYAQSILAAEYSGILEWANRVSLSVPVSGVIAEVNVHEGRRVKQGKVLIALDRRYFEAKLAAARALMSRYKPGHDEARRELGRAEELYERTVLSQVELDKAKNDYAEKEALYSNAKANHQLARLDMEYSELKAPYDLIVIRSLVVRGQTVVNQYQAIPLVEVADSDRLLVSIVAESSEVNGIGLGDQVDVLHKGRKYQGKIVLFDVDSRTSSIKVSVVVKGISSRLRVGEAVKIKW